ncbi:hypothetical protein [Planomicrobium soli]|uniref:hypothetical protein n=1 Tax=Planomicrobium soli TaxID=1176648 RepID=UPI0015E708CA|nr:hypothetical protein [Planomicrobium soli]
MVCLEASEAMQRQCFATKREALQRSAMLRSSEAMEKQEQSGKKEIKAIQK